MPRKEKLRFEMPPLVRAPGQRSLIARQRLEEVLRVRVVLGDPGCDGEHVRVEDQVLGREADLVRSSRS